VSDGLLATIKKDEEYSKGGLKAQGSGWTSSPQAGFSASQCISRMPSLEATQVTSTNIKNLIIGSTRTGVVTPNLILQLRRVHIG
jgi:hypothetical protein